VNALFAEPIDIRRLEVPAAPQADGVGALVVRQHDQNVGSPGSGKGDTRSSERQRADQQERDSDIHRDRSVCEIEPRSGDRM
jgi:hypothetical protein